MNIKIPYKCDWCGYTFIEGDTVVIETIAHIKYEKQSPLTIPDDILKVKAYHASDKWACYGKDRK
jgi:hypothetical protein